MGINTGFAGTPPPSRGGKDLSSLAELREKICRANGSGK